MNLSEAAALRDQATVVRLIGRGEDPYLRREVRADLLFNERTELTPLEAAIASGRAEVAEIILLRATPPEPPSGAACDAWRSSAATRTSSRCSTATGAHRPGSIARASHVRGSSPVEHPSAGAAAAIFLLAVLWQFLTYNGFPNDHYFHVARARQMLLGEWPVRDFVDPGAPLQYVISAASRWLFGDVAGPELPRGGARRRRGSGGDGRLCVVAGAFGDRRRRRGPARNSRVAAKLQLPEDGALWTRRLRDCRGRLVRVSRAAGPCGGAHRDRVPDAPRPWALHRRGVCGGIWG